MRLPFVLRWQLDLSEQRRIDDRAQQDRTIQTITQQRDREQQHAEEWRTVATQARADLMELQQKYHDLATNPPTGIMKGPTLIDPLEGFEDKTKAAIRTVTKGRPRDVQDALVKKARTLMSTVPNITDEMLANRVLRGEYSG